MVKFSANRVSSFAMLGLALLNLVLPLFILSSIHMVRRCRRDQIKSGQVKTIEKKTFVFSDSEFDDLYFKHPGEFVWLGEYYDIHTLRQEDGNYIIEASADEKDRKLNLLSEDLQNSQNNLAANFSLASPFLFFEDGITNPPPFIFSENQTYFLSNWKLPSGPSPSQPSPPPDRA